MTETINLPAALDELREYPQWVTWRYEGDPHPRTGKRPKILKNPKTGGNAMTNTPSTWASYDRAVWAMQHYGHDGLGFVFTKDDPFVGVDLDNCIAVDDTVDSIAYDIILELNTYAEVSPSGSGIHLICRGEIDRALKVADIGDGVGLEIYDTVRWFTITGERVPLVPNDDAINNAQPALDALIAQYRPAQSAPELPTPRPAPASLAPAARREWADRVLERAADIVASAPDGHKHHARLKAARLAGGLIPLGLADEQSIVSVLYNANPPAANARTELAAIKDGIAHGARTPLTEPAVNLPNFDQGWALCPTHGRPLRRSKNGNGWRCGMRDSASPTGWCGFWWQGEGYAPPASLEDAPTPPPTARLINMIHWTELRSLPKPEWLIEGEVPKRSVIMLYGPSGTGKSFQTVAWCAQLSINHTVLYIAPEGGSGYQARLDAWVEHHKRPAGKLYFVVHPINLTDPLYVESIITAAKGINPCLIVFDTLARSMSGADENSSRDMGMIHEACDRIKTELDASVLYVHHTGVNTERYRGSSALKGAADTMIALSKKADDTIELTWEKNKDFEDGYTKKIRLIKSGPSLVSVPADQVTRRYDEGLSTEERKVLTFVAMSIFAEHGAPATDIMRGCGYAGGAAFYEVINALKERGYVKQGQKRDPYFITDKGRDALAGIEPTTYAEPEGYGIDDAEVYAADEGIIDIIKEAIQRLAFDEAQTLAAGIQSPQRQAAAMIRIQQLRAAHVPATLDAPLDMSTLTAEAEGYLDNALATIHLDGHIDLQVRAATVNNAIVDYADLCQRNALTVLWHQRKADYDYVNEWLDKHFNEDEYYVNE